MHTWAHSWVCDHVTQGSLCDYPWFSVVSSDEVEGSLYLLNRENQSENYLLIG